MKTSPPNGDELVYTAQVAKELKKDVRTVHRMVRNGRLVPAAKGPGLRGSLVFRRSDVEALKKSDAA